MRTLAISTSLTATQPTPGFVLARASGADGIRVAACVRKGESVSWLDGGSFDGRAGVPGTFAIAALIPLHREPVSRSLALMFPICKAKRRGRVQQG